MRIDRTAVDAGRNEGREIPRGRKHLAGAGKVEIALLVAERADRHALIGIALHDALHPAVVHDRAVVLAAFGHGGGVHADRREDALFEQGCDRRA